MHPQEQPSPYPFPIKRGNLLDELAAKWAPTKRLHDYLPYYWLHFRDIREQVTAFLEIGVESGRSLFMWEEFFPNAMIYGLDINPECKQFEGGRRKIYIGSQANPELLQKIVADAGRFDVIIDDGSHQVVHQLTSFNHLFAAMTSHGIYVIEDTGTCVGDHGLQVINGMKTLVDGIQHWPNGFPALDWPYLSEFPPETNWLAKNVIGVAFYRFIVFVMRGNNPGDNPWTLPLSERPR